MIRGYDRLLELQELDSAMDRLEARKAELESGAELHAAQDAAREREDRVGELRLGLDSQGREQSRLEGDVSSLEQKIAAEEKRLYDGSVANPKELESIQHEVASLRTRKTRIEDELLEQMERREALEIQLPPLETQLAEARKHMEELEASSVDELRQIGETLVERRAHRETLVPSFDEELLELYEDLRAQKRGVGAAGLADGVCGGCRQKLSPLELEHIKKAEGIRRCDYCRRILVLE